MMQIIKNLEIINMFHYKYDVNQVIMKMIFRCESNNSSSR